ncbi:phosphotransferase family protein [Microbacterium sp. A93]|uniref:phosphotransferase family protein n=1 Tax=unclassified Microbacterium TaxID=2609290 RepID=UPI003F431C19
MIDADLEVVRTREEASLLGRPPLLVLDALADHLREVGLGDGDLQWSRIGDGHSNITYLLDVGGRKLVLRRGPRPPLPPSTHDMLREARVQRLLGAAGVPVPEILDVCADESVLGVPFYVMEHLDGDVVTDRMPPALDDAEGRRALPFAAVDTLAGLHALDVSTEGLSTLGRPDGYLRRQVERFASLWPNVSRRTLPEVDRLADWLLANLPVSARASVVHGDYRIGNLMYRREGPASVHAILDWEMATLGDPLADLGYLVATYAEADAVPTPLELTTVTRGEGYPRRADLIERYVERTGADVSALAWYEVLALWKAAVFCEAIYTRWLDGERPGDTFAPTLAQGVPVLLAQAAARAAA